LIAPVVKFTFDVVGRPAACAARTEMNPPAVELTWVTFRNTPVAPAGTTVLVPVAVGMEPVTVR
jgi:hypothetical protein